jgi:hypothetical protein
MSANSSVRTRAYRADVKSLEITPSLQNVFGAFLVKTGVPQKGGSRPTGTTGKSRLSMQHATQPHRPQPPACLVFFVSACFVSLLQTRPPFLPPSSMPPSCPLPPHVQAFIVRFVFCRSHQMHFACAAIEPSTRTPRPNLPHYTVA